MIDHHDETPPRCCKGWNCLMPLKAHEEEFCRDCVRENAKQEAADSAMRDDKAFRDEP